MIQPPSIVLAPMEGMVDPPMRAFLSEIGGFTHGVAEFLRVTQEIPPDWVIQEHVPELRTNARTAAGLPIHVQLLGGSPELLAQSAIRACHLGAPAIDLNFGCPAKTVNRHDGGATLLKFPERIRSIVEAVRTAVPPGIPVSAKLRLGWENPEDIHENASRAAEGGATWITIHGRTRAQGYAPPALWKPIGEVRRRLGIPVIANGDLWSVEEILRCRDETGCEHFMLGRGAMADPLLALRAAAALNVSAAPAFPEWLQGESLAPGTLPWHALVERFLKHARSFSEKQGYLPRRIKQWVRLAFERGHFPAFEKLKTLDSETEMLKLLHQNR